LNFRSLANENDYPPSSDLDAEKTILLSNRGVGSTFGKIGANFHTIVINSHWEKCV